MKVYEILSEAPNLGPTTTTPSGIIIPQSAATPASATTTPSTPTPTKPTSPGQDINKWVKSRQKKWRSNKTRAARVEKVWMGKYGYALTGLMKLLGVSIALGQLYVDLDGLEEDYNNGEINKAQVESAREFLYGVFSAQILVPAVARRLASARIIVFIARIIKNIAAGLGAGVTGGASIAAAIATEGFFIWLQSWLGSDAGKDWIANNFLMGIVKTVGKIPEGAWSSLTDYYEKLDKNKEQAKKDLAKKDPAKAAKQDAEDKAAAEKEKEILSKEKFVGGVRVTDFDGKLIPGIENNIRVKAAIQRDLAAGKPNPLDALK